MRAIEIREAEEEENYSEANLNSSILLSEKFEISINSQCDNCPDEEEEEDAQRFVEDLNEEDELHAFKLREEKIAQTPFIANC